MLCPEVRWREHRIVSTTPASRARRWLILPAAAAVVAGCLGSTPSQSPSVAIPTASATPAPSAPPSLAAVPSPTATAVEPPTTWYPVGVTLGDSGAGFATMTAVTPTWFGYLAVGDTPRGGSTWWSTDGTSWQAAAYDIPSMRNADVTGVAATDRRLVAIGSIERSLKDPLPMVWTSVDGLAWTAEALPGAPALNGIVATADGFVAVATADPDSETGQIWRSADGLQWSSTELDGVALQIAVGPAGILATGAAEGATGERNAGWLLGSTGDPTPVDLPDHFGALTGGAAAYVAVSAEDPNAGTPGGQIYRSVDGVNWQALPASPVRDEPVVTAAEVAGVGTVAVVGPGDDLEGLQVLRSADGSAWTPVTSATPLDTHASIVALAAVPGMIVGVGAGAGGPAAWLALPTGAEAPAPPEVQPVSTACPAHGPGTDAAILLTELLPLTDARRVQCFGAATLHLRGYLAVPDGLGGYCVGTVSPEWLSGGCMAYPAAWLERDAAPFGRADTLLLYAHASLESALKEGHWVALTGHFDDASSTSCRSRDETGALDDPIKVTVARCRSNFVVTAVTRLPASPAVTVSPDPAALLGLPETYRIAPATDGWDNLVLPVGTVFGFRSVTAPDAITSLVTVFRATGVPQADVAKAALLSGAFGPDAITTSTVGGVAVSVDATAARAIFEIKARVYIVTVLDTAASGASEAQLASLQGLVQQLVASAGAD